jgi:hypothetical protein
VISLHINSELRLHSTFQIQHKHNPLEKSLWLEPQQYHFAHKP